ncbi:hypothetical protein D3C72_1910240 [compost metagenome]
MTLTGHQHIRVFQVGAADVQGAFPAFAGRNGSNYIGLIMIQAIDHVTDAVGALHFEAQAGA